MEEPKHGPGPIRELSIEGLKWFRMRFHDDSVVHSVGGKVACQLVRAHLQEADNHECRNGCREKQSHASAENKRAHGVGEFSGSSAANQLQGAVGESVAGDDEEDADSSGSLVPQPKKRELENVVVGLATTPSLGDDKGLVGVVAEVDKQGPKAAHAVEVGRRRGPGRPCWLAGQVTL